MIGTDQPVVSMPRGSLEIHGKLVKNTVLGGSVLGDRFRTLGDAWEYEL